MVDYGPKKSCAMCNFTWFIEFGGDHDLCPVCEAGKKRVKTMIKDLIIGERTIGMVVEFCDCGNSRVPIKGDPMGSIMFETHWGGENDGLMKEISSKRICREEKKFISHEYRSAVLVKELYRMKFEIPEFSDDEEAEFLFKLAQLSTLGEEYSDALREVVKEEHHTAVHTPFMQTNMHAECVRRLSV